MKNIILLCLTILISLTNCSNVLNYNECLLSPLWIFLITFLTVILLLVLSIFLLYFIPNFENEGNFGIVDKTALLK